MPSNESRIGISGQQVVVRIFFLSALDGLGLRPRLVCLGLFFVKKVLDFGFELSKLNIL